MFFDPRHARLLTAAAIVVSAGTLAGCESKVTKANYDKVEVGMTLARVEKILGSGTEESAAAGVSITGGGIATGEANPEKVYVWQGDGSKVVVIFKEGKVVQKRQEGLE